MAFCSRKQAATVLGRVHATRGSPATRTGSTADYDDDTSSLGKGGFGAVVKSRHRATGKTVAIKSLRRTDDTATADAAQLRREARFLAEASSGNPYVVDSHGLVLDPATGNHCLVMEYVGPNLADFLSDRPPLPEATVRAFMWQLLTGAETMHKRRIVHRDIKPANVLVGGDEKTVKICDLGLAMSLATERPPYDKVGTASYMAPEVLLGKPDYDARVDAWSLGCVMAEMLTSGKTLFVFNGDEIRQLRNIFSVLGLPDDRTWPRITSLQLAAAVQLPLLGRRRSGLRELFPVQTLSEDGFQVLEGLLACNPGKRLTAAAALKLPWFRSTPCSAAAEKVSRLALLRKKVEAALPIRKGLRAKIIQPRKKTDIFSSNVTKLVQHIRLLG